MNTNDVRTRRRSRPGSWPVRDVRVRLKTIITPVHDATGKHVLDRVDEFGIAYPQPGRCRRVLLGLLARLVCAWVPDATFEGYVRSRQGGKP